MDTMNTYGRDLYEKIEQWATNLLQMSDAGIHAMVGEDAPKRQLFFLIKGYDSAVHDHYRKERSALIEDTEEKIRLIRAASERTLADYLHRLTAAEAELAALKKD